MFAVIVPTAYVYVLVALAIPAVVIERIGAAQALQRSAELTKGNRFKILAIYLLVGAAATVVVGVILLPFFVAVMSDAWDVTTGMAIGMSTPMLVGVSVAGFVVQVALLSYLSALATVMYARVVGINDHVDAEKLAEVFR